MELELGLKITRTRDDITSSTDLRIAKDLSGPVFFSTETETVFILTAFLKGFRREHIDIKINEDGTRISISGVKPVQEMVLMGWVMLKKDVELRAFKKVFRIPGGIILDKIKAKFSDQESTLTIVMPKLLKGIVGVEIEEVEEVRPIATPQSVDDKGEEVPEPEIGPILPETADSRTPGDEEEAKEEIAEPKIEDRTSQAVEIFPGRDDDGGGILQEKPEEAMTEGKEEIDGIVEEPKIEQEPGGLEEAITYPETATSEEIKPEKEIEEKRIPTQETQMEEIAELKEQQGISEAEYVEEEEKTEEIKDEPKSTEFIEADTPPSTHYEEEIHAEPNHEAEADIPQESERHEPAGEPPSTDQERPTETPQPADEPEKIIEDKVQEETPGIGNHEIEEEAKDRATVPEGAVEEGDEHGSAAEMERPKDNGGGGEGMSEGKKRKRRTKPCPPIVFAGSAILVSLIVLVISLIRNSSRKK